LSFDRLQHAAARQQLKLLGGVLAVLVKPLETIDPVIVLIERDVQLPADNGLTIEKKTIAALLKAEVGKVSRNHSIQVGDETFVINEIMSDDGYIVRAFVRG
jgi:hypothetical protein